ncbi:MAG TPA: hypothetical protein VNA23_07785 [Anaerolineales bacterium]|nr:hypothetical protein [Anaerolineales bacterium]
MNNGSPGIFIIMFLFSVLGLWQFSQAVRSVDVVGLFATGALAGAAVTGFFMRRFCARAK